jgi:hypothetical protein
MSRVSEWDEGLTGQRPRSFTTPCFSSIPKVIFASVNEKVHKGFTARKTNAECISAFRAWRFKMVPLDYQETTGGVFGTGMKL